MKQNRHYLNALCHCCGRTAWAASAQSFTLWQQATIEITRSLLSSPLLSSINCSLASQALLEVTHQDHAIFACSDHRYIWAGSFLKCFRDPNRVPRIRENYHWVPIIREIGSLHVHTGVKRNFWLTKFLTSHQARMHRVIFYIPNTLIKLIIRA